MRLGPRTVAVVTGGAHGIGRALVAALVGRGVATVALDVDTEGLAAVAKDDDLVVAHPCDVADARAVEAAARAVGERFGRVDLLVNNGGAAICNVLSTFALVGAPGKAAYAASKHAAKGLTETLGAELRTTDIVVSAAYPGATRTGLVRRGRAADADQQEREAAFLERGMPPERVAGALLRGVERGRRRIVIGLDARAVDLASRVAPALTRWAIERLAGRVDFL